MAAPPPRTSPGTPRPSSPPPPSPPPPSPPPPSPPPPSPTPLVRRTIDDVTIDDERSFRHVGLYGDLKEVLRRAKYSLRILPASSVGRWDRALVLNLTFWGANEGGDVLVDDEMPADVVTHAAWHHLAARALEPNAGAPLSADALFLGEAIASAFDVYLVGRLLGHSPESTFLGSQVPAMEQAASDAGLSEEDFTAMLEGIAKDPERAFEDLRQLLFDATSALMTSRSAEEGLASLVRFDEHRFASLLHHYELSSWVLYARAYAKDAATPDPRARAIDHALREAPDAVAWLTKQWVDPALRT